MIALEPPVWKSLRHEVEGIVFVQNLFLVFYNQLKAILKSNSQKPVEFVIPIPVRFIRDVLDVCR